MFIQLTDDKKMKSERSQSETVHFFIVNIYFVTIKLIAFIEIKCEKQFSVRKISAAVIFVLIASFFSISSGILMKLQYREREEKTHLRRVDLEC